jgi:HPt (histidine-containing phosphotransfer) domain-containing protein
LVGLSEPTRPDPLRDISRRAWQTNQRRADQLVLLVSELRDQLRADGTVSEDRRERATTLTHQLVGSAGTFGYAQVSATARRIEGLLLQLPALEPDGFAELTQLVKGVRDSLQHEPSTDL